MLRLSRLLCLLLVVAVGACSGSGGVELSGTTWIATEVDGTAVPSSVRAEITFDENQVGGSDGCNSFGGPYEASGDGITFGDLASTAMSCEGPPGRFSAAFQEAMVATTSARTEGSLLVLLDDEGRERIAFSPA